VFGLGPVSISTIGAGPLLNLWYNLQMIQSVNDSCWLVCKKCGAKEFVQQETTFGPCPVCGGSPRYAENDHGQPMFVFSGPFDFEDWGETC